MTINRLLKDTSFGPEEITVINTAFEDVCRTLGLTDRKAPVAETVATAVLRAAEAGTDCADHLQQRALILLQWADLQTKTSTSASAM